MGCRVKSELKKIDATRRELFVSIPWEEVAAEYDAFLDKQAQKQIAGFRPGKTPHKLIEKQNSKALLTHFSTEVASHFFMAANKELALSPVGPVSIDQVTLAKGREFSFRVEFDVMPEFDLPELSAIDCSKAKDDNAKRDVISLYLLENTDFAPPKTLVEQEQMLSNDDRTAAEARVKLLLIFDAIAKRDGVEVDDRDVAERINEIAKSQELSAAELRKDIEAQGGIGRIRAFLIAESVLDYILEIQ